MLLHEAADPGLTGNAVSGRPPRPTDRDQRGAQRDQQAREHGRGITVDAGPMRGRAGARGSGHMRPGGAGHVYSGSGGSAGADGEGGLLQRQGSAAAAATGAGEGGKPAGRGGRHLNVNADVPTPFVLPWTWYSSARLYWAAPKTLSVTVEVDGMKEPERHAAVMHSDEEFGFRVDLNCIDALDQYNGLHLMDIQKLGASNLHYVLSSVGCKCAARAAHEGGAVGGGAAAADRGRNCSCSGAHGTAAAAHKTLPEQLHHQQQEQQQHTQAAQLSGVGGSREAAADVAGAACGWGSRGSAGRGVQPGGSASPEGQMPPPMPAPGQPPGATTTAITANNTRSASPADASPAAAAAPPAVGAAAAAAAAGTGCGSVLAAAPGGASPASANAPALLPAPVPAPAVDQRPADALAPAILGGGDGSGGSAGACRPRPASANCVAGGAGEGSPLGRRLSLQQHAAHEKDAGDGDANLSYNPLRPGYCWCPCHSWGHHWPKPAFQPKPLPGAQRQPKQRKRAAESASASAAADALRGGGGGGARRRRRLDPTGGWAPAAVGDEADGSNSEGSDGEGGSALPGHARAVAARRRLLQPWAPQLPLERAGRCSPGGRPTAHVRQPAVVLVSPASHSRLQELAGWPQAPGACRRLQPLQPLQPCTLLLTGHGHGNDASEGGVQADAGGPQASQQQPDMEPPAQQPFHAAGQTSGPGGLPAPARHAGRGGRGVRKLCAGRRWVPAPQPGGGIAAAAAARMQRLEALSRGEQGVTIPADADGQQQQQQWQHASAAAGGCSGEPPAHGQGVNRTPEGCAGQGGIPWGDSGAGAGAGLAGASGQSGGGGGSGSGGARKWLLKAALAVRSKWRGDGVGDDGAAAGGGAPDTSGGGGRGGSECGGEAHGGSDCPREEPRPARVPAPGPRPGPDPGPGDLQSLHSDLPPSQGQLMAAPGRPAGNGRGGRGVPGRGRGRGGGGGGGRGEGAGLRELPYTFRGGARGRHVLSSCKVNISPSFLRAHAPDGTPVPLQIQLDGVLRPQVYSAAQLMHPNTAYLTVPRHVMGKRFQGWMVSTTTRTVVLRLSSVPGGAAGAVAAPAAPTQRAAGAGPMTCQGQEEGEANKDGEALRNRTSGGPSQPPLPLPASLGRGRVGHAGAGDCTGYKGRWDGGRDQGQMEEWEQQQQQRGRQGSGQGLLHPQQALQRCRHVAVDNLEELRAVARQPAAAAAAATAAGQELLDQRPGQQAGEQQPAPAAAQQRQQQPARVGARAGAAHGYNGQPSIPGLELLTVSQVLRRGVQSLVTQTHYIAGLVARAHFPPAPDAGPDTNRCAPGRGAAGAERDSDSDGGGGSGARPQCPVVLLVERNGVLLPGRHHAVVVYYVSPRGDRGHVLSLPRLVLGLQFLGWAKAPDGSLVLRCSDLPADEIFELAQQRLVYMASVSAQVMSAAIHTAAGAAAGDDDGAAPPPVPSPPGSKRGAPPPPPPVPSPSAKRTRSAADNHHQGGDGAGARQRAGGLEVVRPAGGTAPGAALTVLRRRYTLSAGFLEAHWGVAVRPGHAPQHLALAAEVDGVLQQERVLVETTLHAGAGGRNRVSLGPLPACVQGLYMAGWGRTAGGEMVIRAVTGHGTTAAAGTTIKGKRAQQEGNSQQQQLAPRQQQRRPTAQSQHSPAAGAMSAQAQPPRVMRTAAAIANAAIASAIASQRALAFKRHQQQQAAASPAARPAAAAALPEAWLGRPAYHDPDADALATVVAPRVALAAGGAPSHKALHQARGAGRNGDNAAAASALPMLLQTREAAAFGSRGWAADARGAGGGANAGGGGVRPLAAFVRHGPCACRPGYDVRTLQAGASSVGARQQAQVLPRPGCIVGTRLALARSLLLGGALGRRARRGARLMLLEVDGWLHICPYCVRVHEGGGSGDEDVDEAAEAVAGDDTPIERTGGPYVTIEALPAAAHNKRFLAWGATPDGTLVLRTCSPAAAAGGDEAQAAAAAARERLYAAAAAAAALLQRVRARRLASGAPISPAWQQNHPQRQGGPAAGGRVQARRVSELLAAPQCPPPSPLSPPPAPRRSSGHGRGGTWWPKWAPAASAAAPLGGASRRGGGRRGGRGGRSGARVGVMDESADYEQPDGVQGEDEEMGVQVQGEEDGPPKPPASKRLRALLLVANSNAEADHVAAAPATAAAAPAAPAPAVVGAGGSVQREGAWPAVPPTVWLPMSKPLTYRLFVKNAAEGFLQGAKMCRVQWELDGKREREPQMMSVFRYGSATSGARIDVSVVPHQYRGGYITDAEILPGQVLLVRVSMAKNDQRWQQQERHGGGGAAQNGDGRGGTDGAGGGAGDAQGAHRGAGAGTSSSGGRGPGAAGGSGSGNGGADGGARGGSGTVRQQAGSGGNGGGGSATVDGSSAPAQGLGDLGLPRPAAMWAMAGC